MFLLSALWRPNIWPKTGFPWLFEKKILSQFLSYLAFTLMGWVFWTLFILVLLSSILDPWRPNICSRKGFQNFSSHYPPVANTKPDFFRRLCSIHNDCKTRIFVEYFWIRWVVIGAGVYCLHLWVQHVCFVLILNHGLWKFWSIARTSTFHTMTRAINWRAN